MRFSIAVISFFICLLGVAQNAKTATDLAAMEREVTLTHSVAVDQYITQYTSDNKKNTQDALDCFLPYDEPLRALFIENNIPQELRYLALSYFLDDSKRLPSKGPFYLEKALAMESGLTITDYVDERLDILDAARIFCAQYAKDSSLDWPAVITKYVAGSGRWSTAQKQQSGVSEKELIKTMPHSIGSAYPKYVSAVYLAKNFESLGFAKHISESSKEVEITKYTTLYQLSRALETDYDLVKRENPKYTKEIIPNDGDPHTVMLSAEAASRFQKLAEKAYDYTSTEVYTATEVKIIASESIESSTSDQLEPAFTEDELAGGDSILIDVTYRVRKGDMLLKIADLFDCEVVEIVRWNNVNKDDIDINQTLIIKVDPAKQAYYQQIDRMTNEQRRIIIKKD